MRLRLSFLGALAITLGIAAPATATTLAGAPILAIAGTGTACSTPPACGDLGLATQSQLSFPEGIAIDAHGNTYVADWGDNEIRRIAPGGAITTVAGGGSPCWGPPACGDGGAATDAQLSFPDGVAAGPDGSVYIADTGDNEIRRVSPDGKVTRFAGDGTECAQPPGCGDGGPATKAQLRAPAAVALDKSGNVYIVDTGDSEVRKVSATGTISRVAGTGVFCSTAPSCGDGGPATSAQLNYPGGLTIDASGALFIADGGDNEVRKVTGAGTISRIAGNGGQCASPPACGDGGAATSAQLSGPDGVGLAPSGAVYIADAGDNEVRAVSASGKIGLLAGTGTACSTPSSCGDGGLAAAAQLNYPDALAVDPSGDVYIADTYDAELRWVPGGGNATLGAGTGKVAFSAFTPLVSSQAVAARYALSGPAALTLSVGTTIVGRVAGHPGLGVISWNRRLGGAKAPAGRYKLTVTAAAGGHTASLTLSVRLT